MSQSDLARFIEAQAPVAARVEAELAAGAKHSHWMWFVFPQLAGLGHSAMAQRYAIGDADEARHFLADVVLGERLRRNVRLMLGHSDKSAHDILGSPDDLKFHSCLTLFHEVAETAADRALFASALARYYEGKPDRRTLELLGPGRSIA
ncbi:MAG: DUF1810 domain-containing protein [Rhizobiales bacterium]|nr:DUF1810 domain-containing protein [Hyphomicrobiales bacterium]MBI3672445.1 DUF1810 domain-containing protein [Hyphomicrobiales bacterium]